MGTRTQTWPWGRWGVRGGWGPVSSAVFWGRIPVGGKRNCLGGEALVGCCGWED